MRRENSIPVFAASTPMSSKTASSCARMKSDGSSCTAVTAAVLCAVSATRAVVPCAPAAANAFRSAWIPAPPPESDVAIGRTGETVMRLPSPVRAGSGSTGVISAPLGTPVTEVKASVGLVSVVAPAWLELLQGDELAHVSVEAARSGTAEPFPDDLDPGVASALVGRGITALYRHQAEAWEALRAGGHAIVTTSTASGKSLGFNLPVLDMLANLRYVVVDEAHVYRGVFGSHVANVLRRLRRLARAYGSEPQFVLASATIANAAELAESLLGEPATVVDSDAAPATERTIALWNPELIDVELGVRASALGDASRLLAGFVTAGRRTICFAKSRPAGELIHRFASDRLEPALAARIAPY